MIIAFLDAATLGDDLELESFREFGDVRIYPGTTPEEMTAHLKDVDIAIVNKTKMNAAGLDGAEKLKLICVAATGYDGIDTAYCASRGIAVCNVAGYSTESVAQLTLALALTLANRLTEYTAAVRDGSYTRSGVANKLTPPFHELYGKTWGIVGYGHIGRRVGDMARALGCRVLAFKRTPDLSVETVDLDTLLRRSDIVSIHLPLTSETRGLISRKKLELMKPESILINVARGAVTDEAAVRDAVLENRLGGIGIDVYSTEPFGMDHPFYAIRNLPNVCLTPHMAWGTVEARIRCMDEIKENIRDYFRGGRRSRIV